MPEDIVAGEVEPQDPPRGRGSEHFPRELTGDKPMLINDFCLAECVI